LRNHCRHNQNTPIISRPATQTICHDGTTICKSAHASSEIVIKSLPIKYFAAFSFATSRRHHQPDNQSRPINPISSVSQQKNNASRSPRCSALVHYCSSTVGSIFQHQMPVGEIPLRVGKKPEDVDGGCIICVRRSARRMRMPSSVLCPARIKIRNNHLSALNAPNGDIGPILKPVECDPHQALHEENHHPPRQAASAT
jgi:hypothetical protein